MKKYQCRGLQCSSPATRRRVARAGNKALREKGLSHQFDSKSAKKASKKGVAVRFKK